MCAANNRIPLEDIPHSQTCLRLIFDLSTIVITHDELRSTFQHMHAATRMRKLNRLITRGLPSKVPFSDKTPRKSTPQPIRATVLWTLFGSVALILFTACSQMNKESTMPNAPIADKREHIETHHGYEISDPYHWLKDASYPEIDDEDVLEYLRQENSYFENFIAPISPLVDQIFEELKGRLDQEDASVPIRDGNYVYQSKYETGKQYRVHLRWLFASAGSDLLSTDSENIQVLIDENELAGDSDYFSLGSRVVSPSDELLAYSTDHDGSERYTLQIKYVDSNEFLSEKIENVTGSIVWANDSSSFLYVTLDDNLRPNRVLLHTLGSDPAQDKVVYEEQDVGFFVSIGRTTSRKFARLSTSDHVTSEVRIIGLDDLSKEPRVVAPRKENHYYQIDHRLDSLLILTNDTHKNSRLASTSDQAIEQQHWKTVLEASDDRYITNMQALRDRIVVGAREEGLDQVLLSNREGEFERISFPEETYSAGFYYSPEDNPSHLRIGYSSLVTPHKVFDYAFETGERITRKTQRIPSGYSAELYSTERRWATSHDGVRVPVSIAYRNDTPLDGSAPLYLEGYGAYGIREDPYFSTSRLSLLDRGFVFAMAHIRGGSEMGYQWYEDGKLDKRTNTFLDFIAVARYLIDENYTGKGRIAISGGSAGGTLMGVVANDAPALWGAVVSHVPFVDVLNTMLDNSLPLTPIEWPEWGNPILDKEAFEYIRSYSPYDQIEAQDYPPMLVTAGLNDPRVTYWEPAKYVAKLRSLKTDENPLVLRTQMGAGHSGVSGRYDSLREIAETYAFILTVMSIEEPAIE